VPHLIAHEQPTKGLSAWDFRRKQIVLRASLAQLAKRDFDRARELWDSMLGNSREGYEAYEQLAIYYEHQARDTQRALAIASEALAQLRRAHQVAMIAAGQYRARKLQFEHQRMRLERKTLAMAPSLFNT